MSSAPFALFLRLIRPPVFGRAKAAAPRNPAVSGEAPELGPSGRRASETKSLTHPHWNSGYPTRHPAINHKILDNRRSAFFGNFVLPFP